MYSDCFGVYTLLKECGCVFLVLGVCASIVTICFVLKDTELYFNKSMLVHSNCLGVSILGVVH